MSNQIPLAGGFEMSNPGYLKKYYPKYLIFRVSWTTTVPLAFCYEKSVSNNPEHTKIQAVYFSWEGFFCFCLFIPTIPRCQNALNCNFY